MAGLSLSDAIRHLRRELAQAQAGADPKGLRFEMREIELELQLVANEVTDLEAQGDAGGSIWSVVTLKGSASASRSTGEDRTHRVKLTMGLAPKPDGKPSLISGPGEEPR